MVPSERRILARNQRGTAVTAYAVDLPKRKRSRGARFATAWAQSDL